MERRSIESGCYQALIATGVAIVVGALTLQTTSGFSRPLIIVGCIAILAGIGGLALLWFTAPELTEIEMGKETKRLVVGLDIENKDGGVGLDIQSTGTSTSPSLGGESIVHAPLGQSAIGTRVVQSGPGVGMRVVQNGPGVGFRSVVIVGEPTEKP